MTEHPTQDWVSQQARNLTWRLQEQGSGARFLICDNDKKFPFAFEHVLAGEGVRVIRTPLQAPKANAHAERWVGTARRECLDWVIIGGLRHLERVLDEYVDHYNNERPHRGLQLHPPNGPLYPVSAIGAIRCRSRLADCFASTHARQTWLLHEYLHPTAFVALDAGDNEQALDVLIEAIARARSSRDEIRRVVVSILDELDLDHPLATRSRTRLASAIY